MYSDVTAYSFKQLEILRLLDLKKIFYFKLSLSIKSQQATIVCFIIYS